MFQTLAGNIALFFVENKIIKEDDKDIYSYGMEYVLSSTTAICLALGISLFLNRFFETIAFLSAFAVLRVFAGGYHASSHAKCILTFTTVYIINILVLNYLISINSVLPIYIMNLISFVLILTLSPIEHENKPFDCEEYTLFKKKSRFIITIETLIAVIGISIFSSIGSLFISLSLGAMSAAVSVAVAKYIKKG